MFLLLFTTEISAGILGYRAPFSPRDPPAHVHVHHLRAAIVLFSAFLRTWRAVGRGIFPLFHLTIVLASLLVHVWMAARSVTVTGTTSRPLPTSSSTCRTGGTLSRIPRAGVLYWDDIDNGTLSIEFSMLLFCPPATSRAAPEIFIYVSLLIISSSHTSNLSLVFRFRSQAWSIRPRGRNISHFLHLHDLLDVRS